MEYQKVTVLLEDLRTQFRTFGEGLQLINDKIEKLSINSNSLPSESKKPPQSE